MSKFDNTVDGGRTCPQPPRHRRGGNGVRWHVRYETHDVNEECWREYRGGTERVGSKGVESGGEKRLGQERVRSEGVESGGEKRLGQERVRNVGEGTEEVQRE